MVLNKSEDIKPGLYKNVVIIGILFVYDTKQETQLIYIELVSCPAAKHFPLKKIRTYLKT